MKEMKPLSVHFVSFCKRSGGLKSSQECTIRTDSSTHSDAIRHTPPCRAPLSSLRQGFGGQARGDFAPRRTRRMGRRPTKSPLPRGVARSDGVCCLWFLQAGAAIPMRADTPRPVGHPSPEGILHAANQIPSTERGGAKRRGVLPLVSAGRSGDSDAIRHTPPCQAPLSRGDFACGQPWPLVSAGRSGDSDAIRHTPPCRAPLSRGDSAGGQPNPLYREGWRDLSSEGSAKEEAPGCVA